MAKPESQNTLLEGAKLISKWFHFRGYHLIIKLDDHVDQYLQLTAERVKHLVKRRKSVALADILKCINHILFGEMRFRVLNEDDFIGWKHLAASIHWVLFRLVSFLFLFLFFI